MRSFTGSQRSDEVQPTPDAPSAGGPKTDKPNEKIRVTLDGGPWAGIVIGKVAVKAKSTSRYHTDKPGKGNLFIQALVTDKALANGVDDNPLDWQVFAAGEAVENTTIRLDSPKPALPFGNLPKGRTAGGWVVYEVPKAGEVSMSYQGNIVSDEGPVFEVVIRAH